MKDARASFAVVLPITTWFVFVQGPPATGCYLERQTVREGCTSSVRQKCEKLSKGLGVLKALKLKLF